jgi:hypothetical protein
VERVMGLLPVWLLSGETICLSGPLHSLLETVMPRKPRQPRVDLERLQIDMQQAGFAGLTLRNRDGRGELVVPRKGQEPAIIADTGKLTNGPDDRITAAIDSILAPD